MSSNLIGGAISSLRNAFIETVDYLGKAVRVLAVTLVDVTGTMLGASGNPFFIADAYAAPLVATWTSATALNTVNSGSTLGMDGVMVSIVCPATITGGVLTFEVFDGASWVPVQAGKMNAYGGALTVTLAANLQVGYQLNTSGGTQFRTRLSTVITGTGNVLVTHLATSAPMPDPLTVGLDPAQPLPAGTSLLGAAALSGAPNNTTGTPLTPLRITTAASGVIKAGAGRLYGADLLNVQASARYLQIYNKASAGIPGTDTPVITIPLAASAAKASPIGDIGVYEATGLSWAITTDAPGVTAGASGDILGTLYYA